MRNMVVKIRPRHEDRKVELLYEYTEKKLNEKREPDMVISLDIANAMAFANQLTEAVEILLNDGVPQMAVGKSTPILAEEDPTHRKKI